MAQITYYIENSEDKYIQHEASDRIQYVLNGKKTGMTVECQELLNNPIYNPSNLIAKTIEIDLETEKVLKWVGLWPDLIANIIPSDWTDESKSIRITVREKLLKSNGKFKDLAFDLMSDNPINYKKWVDNKKFKIVYLEYLRVDDGFSFDEDGNIISPDSDLVIEQIRTDFVIREIDEENCIAPPL